MRRFLVCAAWGVLLAAPSWAGDYPRGEFFGLAHWWDTNGAPIDGMTAGGGAGVRLLPQFAAEFEVLGFFGRREGPALSPESTAHGFLSSVNGILYLGRHGSAVPFVLLGAGVGYSTSDISFYDYRDTISHTGFLVNGGCGVEVFLNRHVAVRPEVRILAGNSGSSSNAPYTSQVRFAIGIVYHK